MSSWNVISMEGVPTSPDEPAPFSRVRARVTELRDRRLLGDGPQHWKPDGILGIQNRTSLHILIVDVTWASDAKLVIEDDILDYWQSQRGPPFSEVPGLCLSLTDQLQSDWFDERGRFTLTGLQALPEDLRTRASTLSVFHPARYAQRYQALARGLQSSPSFNVLDDAYPPRGVVHVRTLAIGVGGWIPRYSRRLIRKLINKDSTQAEKVRKSLRHGLRMTAATTAVQAYRIWQEEVRGSLHPL